MSKLRATWLCAVIVALSACASSGTGTVSDRASDDDAAVANLNLGAGYLRQGRNDLAIERLQRALAQNPRLVQAHSTIAVAYDQVGAVDEAETHYRRATQLAPADGGAANAYAVFLCRQNRWNDAEPYFRRAADDRRYATPEVALTNAGVCARSAGANDKAAESFRAALARSPTYRDALLNMMELSYQSSNYIQARAFVQRYLDSHPATAPVLWMCFNVERELENQAAADRCAAQLRAGFRGTPELAQLEEQQRRDGR
jgi:type IV pilus assembly protein PilF